MNNRKALHTLADMGVIMTNGHFVYTTGNDDSGGKHGSVYVNKDLIYPHTVGTSSLCYEIASEFSTDKVDVVVGPAMGAIVLAQWTANHLTKMNKREVVGVYADKLGIKGAFTLKKRGYDKFVADRRVLVVEDVLTTGTSARAVVEVVRAAGGEVVGLSALVNRGGVTSDDLGNVPKFVSLVSLSLASWDASSCHLCKSKNKLVPINPTVGHGAEFLARRGQ